MGNEIHCEGIEFHTEIKSIEHINHFHNYYYCNCYFYALVKSVL